jgi:hypothetical protein
LTSKTTPPFSIARSTPANGSPTEAVAATASRPSGAGRSAVHGGGALAGVAGGVGFWLDVLAGVDHLAVQHEHPELVASAVGPEVAGVAGQQPVGVALGVISGGVLQLLLGGDVEGVVAAGADHGPGPGVAAELVESGDGLVRLGPGQDDGLHVGDAVAAEPLDGAVLLGRGAPGRGSGAEGDDVVLAQQPLEGGQGAAAVRRDLVEHDDVGYDVEAFRGHPQP